MLRVLLILFLLIVLGPFLITMGFISIGVVFAAFQPMLLTFGIAAVVLLVLFFFAKADGLVWSQEEGKMIASESLITKMREEHGIVINENCDVVGRVEDIDTTLFSSVRDALK